jgi:hypothetical protein
MLPLPASNKPYVQHRKKASSTCILQRHVWRVCSRKSILTASLLLLFLPIFTFALLTFNYSSSILKTSAYNERFIDQYTVVEPPHHPYDFNKSSSTGKLHLGLVLLPGLGNLHSFATTACHLQYSFRELRIRLFSIQESVTVDDRCQLVAEPLSLPAYVSELSMAILDEANQSKPDFLLVCYESDSFSLPLSSFRRVSPGTTVIQMPCHDLQHTEWLGVLEPRELKSEHTSSLACCAKPLYQIGMHLVSSLR